jgi:hypothetical protein
VIEDHLSLSSLLLPSSNILGVSIQNSDVSLGLYNPPRHLSITTPLEHLSLLPTHSCGVLKGIVMILFQVTILVLG